MIGLPSTGEATRGLEMKPEIARRGRAADLRPHGSDRISTKRSAVLVVTVAAITAAAAVPAFIGADARWLAALGHVITTRGGIPDGLPFAAAHPAHWPNAIVLAELIFHWAESTLGDRGLMLAQLLAVGLAMSVLARDARADGAATQGTAAALLLAAIGALPSLVIARVQLFSLCLFPILVALLRSDARRPSRRVWFVVPLLVLWSNLHGMALGGLGITFVYLALARFRDDPRSAIAVGATAAVSVFLTPAGFRTIRYYYLSLTNVGVQRGQELWAPLSPTSALDIILILAAVVLALYAFRPRAGRPQLWEVAVIVVLGAMTVKSSRCGVWLLLFLVSPAARSIRPRRTWGLLVPAVGIVAVIALAFGIVRGPLPSGGSPAIVARAITLAHGTPVLAADILAEQVALAGGRIWVGNPIDAFSRRDQVTYLDWIQGRPAGTRALNPSSVVVVLVTRGSGAQTLMDRARRFRVVSSDQKTELYVRTH